MQYVGRRKNEIAATVEGNPRLGGRRKLSRHRAIPRRHHSDEPAVGAWKPQRDGRGAKQGEAKGKAAVGRGGGHTARAHTRAEAHIQTARPDAPTPARHRLATPPPIAACLPPPPLNQAQARTHAHTPTHTDKHSHTHIHTHAHTHTHARARAHTHTHPSGEAFEGFLEVQSVGHRAVEE